MRRNKFWILAIAMTIMVFTAGGCVEPLDNNVPGIDPDAISLPIRLYIPGAMPATKASTGFTGDVDGVSPESKIFSVQVWMFNHPTYDGETLVRGGDNEAAVAYTEATINWTPANNIEGSGYYPGGSSGHWNGDIYELPMLIPSNIFDRADEELRFDFYVLANGSSIGNPASRDKKRGELKGLTFGYTSEEFDYFGLSNPVIGLNEKGPGLPIAGFFNKNRTGDATGVDLSYLRPENLEALQQETGFDIKALTPVVQLKRAVSKIRFVFSRPTNMPDVSITDVILDAQTIPDKTWVFENTTTLIPTTSSYNAQKSLGISLATTAIGQIQDPSTLTTDYYNAHPVGEQAATAQGYDKYLTAAIKNTAPQATEKVVYLRESDKAITGKIKYRLPGMKKSDNDLTADFKMILDSNPPKGTDNNNFLRNHYWIVYAYFMGGKLYVKPTVAPWVNATELKYTLKMNTNMRLFDSWLYRYDTDGKAYLEPDPNNEDKPFWNNWATSHMVVSEGKETDGRPLRSPQIQLVTTGVTGSSFDLKVDNDDFEIVQAVKNDAGVVTEYVASTDGALNILAGDNVYTYFYIVPKVGVTLANPVAKVSLIYNDPDLGSVRVPFNYSSLPGYSDDSSEIWAYYFPESEYKIIYDNTTTPPKPDKLKMYYQDSNNPLVPTPVQN